MRFSVRTWYPVNNRDTTTTLMINGRTIFRVVRINAQPLARVTICNTGSEG
jgi:hypothetical protein